MEATKGKVTFANAYEEANELTYMFYYAADLEYKKELFESLSILLRKEMLRTTFASICEKCENWSLYHDCDDPDVLPEKRLKKEPNNCSNYLCNDRSCPNKLPRV